MIIGYKVWIGGVFLFSLAGCDLPPEAKSTFLKLENQITSLWSDLFELPSASLSPSPTPTELELISDASRRGKENSEIFKEIYQVTYIKQPKDRSEFGNWVDTLNQGASLEGVYHGLIQSEDYRQLEVQSKSASPEALRIFSEEFSILGAELSPDSDIRALQEKNIQRYVGVSLFTLKKNLGEEALKVIASKNEYPEKLSLWYSKWVVRLADRNIDFGIDLRNKKDEEFHFKWALENKTDRLSWEVLNRLHRILNEANKEK